LRCAQVSPDIHVKLKNNNNNNNKRQQGREIEREREREREESNGYLKAIKLRWKDLNHILRS